MMRIEAISVPQIPSGAQRPGAASVPEQLQPGTRVQAKVIAREGDTVQLQLEGGAELTARLEGGAFLEPGQEVRLLVTGREEQTVTMSLERGTAQLGGLPAAGGEPAGAAVLRALNLPVTGEILQRMEGLQRSYPSLTPERAAFLAANGIEEPALVQAALNLFESGATTGQMLERLEALLPQPLPEQAQPLPEHALPEPPAVQLPPEQAVQQGQTLPAEQPILAEQPVSTEQPIPPEQVTPPGQSNQTQPDRAAQQPEQAPPASPEQLLREALSQAVQQNQAPPDAAAQQQAVPSAPPPEPSAAVPQQSAETAAPQDWVELLEQLLGPAPDAPPPAATPPQEGIAVPQRATAEPSATEAATPPAAEAPELPEQAQRALSLLRSMPAFVGLPERGMLNISQLLEQTLPPLLRELETAPDKAEGLRRLLDGLFAEVDRGGTAQQLRQAKEELYLKLSVFRDAVQRADLAQKPALLQETQKLMDHVRTMGEIDQFIYMQVPLNLIGQRETAELYFFKNNKRGVRRIDPEDVQILLALNLEHMGHLESLVHIRGTEVSLNLELETDDAVAFTQRETHRLYAMLEEAGFKLTDARITKAADRTTPEGALLTLLRQNRSRVGYDLKI